MKAGVAIHVHLDATRPATKGDIPLLVMFGAYLIINLINQASYG